MSAPWPGTVRRWPLHPQPSPLEALSSWLARLARLYGMPVKDLVRHNLGVMGLDVPEPLDWDPPQEMLAALATRTGADVAQVRAMTLAGWVPWLFDTLSPQPHQEQEIFDAYVRQHTVLFAPKFSRTYDLGRRKPWRGPWIGDVPAHRACPLCATAPDPADALVWQLPLMTSCAEHGRRLEDRMAIELARHGLEPLPVTVVPEPVATLDRYTHQALMVGLVELPGRTVHAGVWFRLLRSLLNELTLSTSVLNRAGKATIAAVWQAADLPERAGLSTWRPYEHLPWSAQETLLCGAATVLQLAADNRITLSGVHASALVPLPYRQVYEGDQPQPDLNALAEQVIAEARVDPAAARQLLNMFTYTCRTLDEFDQERAFLLDEGVPARFLPSAAECGRTDLLRAES